MYFLSNILPNLFNQLEGLQPQNEIILFNGCQHVLCEQRHPDGGGVEMQLWLRSLLAR